jgi:hypothetical protein
MTRMLGLWVKQASANWSNHDSNEDLIKVKHLFLNSASNLMAWFDNNTVQFETQACDGLWRYVPVHTGTFRLVLFSARTVTYLGKLSHAGTYRYGQVYVLEKCQNVRTSTYEYVLFVVYHGTWQYMTVHCSAWRYIAVHIPVHTGMYCYVMFVIVQVFRTQ